MQIKKKITSKLITANIKKFYGKFVFVRENWPAFVYYLIYVDNTSIVLCKQRNSKTKYT